MSIEETDKEEDEGSVGEEEAVPEAAEVPTEEVVGEREITKGSTRRMGTAMRRRTTSLGAKVILMESRRRCSARSPQIKKNFPRWNENLPSFVSA